mmetsp:Transcript_11314/g.32501  ORF Transcript_11314/g.32501 Transcript_11314/m.32501 type:complete len:350 (+) Transcript_11314:95-1144(+)|eukprot:CAMPEP_0119556858 /NCGR_PEP_ID=MMETSP1352-20130426/8682_1 /TAXON_ID=265584 /ORGANISM="Stauroneis constricta, Strain CCMP1120" /LENGTH=349 /DNA_ID=CAMNT_0007603865 /DNA_START=80 /DNA_END=1129 /DNA_ORIENTATION=-
MKSYSSSTALALLLSCLVASTAATSTATAAIRHHQYSIFGIRGGGLFGGKDDAAADKAPTTTDTATTKYPPMTTTEIEDWMEHIPVFAVTDSNGAGVILKPDDGTSVFYFFLNPIAANSTLTQLKSADENMMDLRVSAFSLGKIWFNLLNGGDDKEITVRKDGEEATEKGIQYRLVPDTRDLLGARMLLTMTPEDSEKLKDGQSLTPEMAQAAIEKAMTDSPKFKSTFNEIPIFTIAQMRMQKQQESPSEDPITLLPMYFSLQNMIGTWQQFMSQADAEMQGVEPNINLMSLNELVTMMQTESEIDFRNVVLVPPAPMEEAMGAPGGGASMQQPSAAGSAMGGATLGDL